MSQFPDAMVKNRKDLKKYLEFSYEYFKTLKPEPTRKKSQYDPRCTPLPPPQPGACRQRSDARSRSSGHAERGARCDRGPLSDAAGQDPRPRHATAPGFPAILRLRRGFVP